MSVDIEITRDASGETLMVQVEGLSDDGVELIDSYLPPHAEIVVVDSGRLIIWEKDLPEFTQLCKEHGLKVGEA